MMIAVALISVLLFWFIAEYEFVAVVASANSTSPDRKRTIVVASKTHQSLFRRYRTIEARIVMSNGVTGFTQYHWLGSGEITSTIPPDFQSLGAAAIVWSPDSNSVTYHVTDIESATIWLTGAPHRDTEIHLHESPK